MFISHWFWLMLKFILCCWGFGTGIEVVLEHLVVASQLTKVTGTLYLRGIWTLFDISFLNREIPLHLLIIHSLISFTFEKWITSQSSSWTWCFVCSLGNFAGRQWALVQCLTTLIDILTWFISLLVVILDCCGVVLITLTYCNTLIPFIFLNKGIRLLCHFSVAALLLCYHRDLYVIKIDSHIILILTQGILVRVVHLIVPSLR